MTLISDSYGPTHSYTSARIHVKEASRHKTSITLGPELDHVIPLVAMTPSLYHRAFRLSCWACLGISADQVNKENQALLGYISDQGHITKLKPY